MKAFLAAALLIGFAVPAVAENYDVGYGTFDAPVGYVLKHTGTADSFRGTLTRQADGFVISFDIGYGTRVTRLRPDKDAFIRTHVVNGEFAYTSLKRVAGKLTIATTICDWCERGMRLREELAAARGLPPEQREKKTSELAERMNQLNKEHPHPANFWAEVAREEDLVEFMLIVESYRPTGVVGQ